MAIPDGATDRKVMELVAEELEKNPSASVGELQGKAAEISEEVAEMTGRQFHARYPLQVKRRKLAALRRMMSNRRTGRSDHKVGRSSRDAVRQVFMRFASDLTAAESKNDLVRVLAEIDRYVDQVLES